jgi:hypothetical protein
MMLRLWERTPHEIFTMNNSHAFPPFWYAEERPESNGSHLGSENLENFPKRLRKLRPFTPADDRLITALFCVGFGPPTIVVATRDTLTGSLNG